MHDVLSAIKFILSSIITAEKNKFLWQRHN